MENFEIDNEKLKKLQYRCYNIEKKNLENGKLNETALIDKLIQEIKTEVNNAN